MPGSRHSLQVVGCFCILSLQAMPQVVAESSSEAVFIASRLLEQEEQLAQHAEDTADGPLLAHAHHSDITDDEHPAAAADDVARRKGGLGFNEGAGALEAADHGEESEGMEPGGEGEGGEWLNDDTDDLQAAAAVPGDPDEVKAGAPGAAGGKMKPKFRLLSPLIAVRMTGECCYCFAGSFRADYPSRQDS